MKGRYLIFEDYNGICDLHNLLCVTDSLSDAVHIVELLNEWAEKNPCYSYDFVKQVFDVHQTLDYVVIGSGFDAPDAVLDVKNYSQYKEAIKNLELN